MTHKSSAPSVEGFHKISFWREESVGVVTLLSPGQIDNELMEEMIRIFSIAAMDDKVASILVTGTNYIYSRGLKVPDNRNYADFRDFYKRIQSLVLFWTALEKPIFTAINGTATNNGLALALLGDEVFYSENSKLILDKNEPTVFLGSSTVPEKTVLEHGVLKVKGIETGKERMMEEVFDNVKSLENITYHRVRRKRFFELEKTLLQEEIEFLDFYLWCEGCK
ncbi:MAG: enoyl-CoA hydratase-related protein [Thermoplasmatales archaeon]|nr:enoyl-CoA hydratase-related protein [Candidatus Thermoplasmatota archaeon]MDA8055185.1 enoyl-CoA hydratase-related protein [Thermoplasmatales archaeon]